MPNSNRGGILFACFLAAAGGCSRFHYLSRADRETYATLDQQTAGTPWQAPPGFSILPDPSSRLFDPTPVAKPRLPMPAPQLYAYRLPDLPQRDPDRFRPKTASSRTATSALTVDHRPTTDSPAQDVVVPVSASLGKPRSIGQESIESAPESGILRTAALGSPQPGVPGEVHVLTLQRDAKEPREIDPSPKKPAEERKDEDGLPIVPVPKTIWDSVPPQCLRRMFEFESVRSEYRLSYGKEPGADLRDPSPRLALEDIVELALLNSRPYQTEKERLYLAALVVTFERYQFTCKFTPFDNGTDVDFLHLRTAGITTNTLGIPTRFNADRLLATGGTFLARFANDVLLTFNGPQGFAADIRSELLFDLSQRLLQRDIVFENLTQSERNVVYAARDFARFRKTFFRDLAFRYYSLLNTYRNIQIASQDYFSNLRAFAQLEAEFRVGRRSRIQVDQVEQRALASRSNLIATCNTLESALDDLKFLIGIPPETFLNLELAELEDITLRDQATIAVELVRRVSRNLVEERGEKTPDRATLVNASIELVRRLLEAADLTRRVGGPDFSRAALQDRLAELLVDEAEATVAFERAILAERRKAVPPAPPELIFGRTIALVDSLQTLLQRQLDLAERKAPKTSGIQPLRKRQGELATRRQRLREDMDAAVKERKLAAIPMLLKSAELLLTDMEAQTNAAGKLLGRAESTVEEKLRKALRDANALLSIGETLITGTAFGLPAIDLGMDDGMLTALTQRYDLMNLRGAEADRLRRAKLAADDLKAILNLNATQIIRTDSRYNRPFDFTFDDSETRLGLQFDAPLNRKAQRNVFRRALIDYQVSLRNRMELEDSIKIAVRNDLRALDLDREQYLIAVASAALAFERVLSTRLQLQLGQQGVTARDFVEAQQAYTASLSTVAGQHIGYLRDRISLFLDLELLTVDASGFWPQLYEEGIRPETRFEMPPWPPYGTLPRGVLYSREVRNMLKVPPGQPVVFETEGGLGTNLPMPSNLPEVDPPPLLPAPREIDPGALPLPKR